MLTYSYKYIGVCLVLFICLGSLIGCQNKIDEPKEVGQNTDDIENEMNELREEIIILKTQNQQLLEQINSFESKMIDNKLDIMKEFYEQLYRLEHVVKRLPDLEITMGSILNVKEENDTIFFEIDTVEWLGGEQAIQAIIEDGNMSREEAEQQIPNGFYIRNIEEERIPYQLSTDYSSYIIEESSLKYTNEFINIVNEYMETDEQDDRPIYHFYIIENEIVQILQQYIP
ncbi:hypothetical protein [Chengkuizengella sediminis]|uniref:hypothetical protein n=1 Tax=Chengkuizengella sediminis TaxID=1885917 RepID=UPI00138A2556|nr:hypothetical protein [Chengkuizengella sediminis]NDI35419.1 hypothetical protein [Chengkuizengella sediminis]